MQKCQSTPKNLFCNFPKLVVHEEKDCCAFNFMRERTLDMYSIQEENVKTNGGGQQYNNHRIFSPRNIRNFGRGRGTKKFVRGGKGLAMCYNCNQLGNLARDFLNLCTTCTYYRELDHAT
jgi:hypothetical protein